MSHWQWCQLQAYISYLVPSMGPIISAVTLLDQKVNSTQVDQLAKLGNDIGSA